jgi:hypothetical protein
MKSRLTPVCFEMGRAFNPDANTWETGRQIVLVYRFRQGVLFKMKERIKDHKKQWFVSSNPLPMLSTDNLLLQKTAKKFKDRGIRSRSTYHSRVVYR